MCALKYMIGSRDSFERFGDDLSELILSYLPLSDCYRLQCVSKQFNALIFNKQTKIILTYIDSDFDQNLVIDELLLSQKHRSSLNNRLLQYVLEKCVNITNIKIDYNFKISDETINTISNACKHLTRLYINMYCVNNVSLQCWQRMAENCLKDLESLIVYDTDHVIPNQNLSLITSLLSVCSKLKSIDYTDSNGNVDILFDECFRLNCQQFMNSVESVKLYFIRNESFTKFADYFRHQLKTLHVSIDDDVSIESLKLLACFENLEYLYIDICQDALDFNDAKDRNCVQTLKQIGLKCEKLNFLAIESLSAPFYEVFSGGSVFKSLEKLMISRRDVYEDIALLKKCVQLKHLIFDSTEICESDFNDIHLHLPQLKAFDIFTDHLIREEMAAKLVQSLAKLPNLCDLKIDSDYTDHYITTDKFMSFIDNSLSIRRIGIYPHTSRINKTKIQDYIANNNRKIEIYTLK